MLINTISVSCVDTLVLYINVNLNTILYIIVHQCVYETISFICYKK